MEIYINGQDFSRYQITNRFQYQFEKLKDIAIDRFNFEMVAIDEFKITNDAFIPNASDIITATIYDDNGNIITEGRLMVTGYQSNVYQSNIQVIPDLLSELDTYPQISYPADENVTPADILYSIFQTLDIEDYLDKSSLWTLKGAFVSYGVYCGIDANLTENENTLYDILVDFRKAFLIDIYIKNNKIYFDESAIADYIGYTLSDRYVIGYSESYIEDNMINDWLISTENYSLALEDVDTETGSESRALYGSKPFDISPSLWNVENGAGNPIGTWYSYVIDTMENIISQKEKPEKQVEFEVATEIIEEVSLNDYITYNNYSGYIIGIFRDDYVSRIVVLVDY